MRKPQKNSQWRLLKTWVFISALVGLPLFSFSVMAVDPADLIRILIDENENEVDRVDAALLLGQAKHRRAVVALIRVLRKDKIDDVREAAVIALGNIGSEIAIRPLFEVLGERSESESLRVAAVMALGDFKNDVVTDRLMDTFSDESVKVRKAVAKALGNQGSYSVISPLLKRLNRLEEEDPKILLKVIQAIGKIGERVRGEISQIKSGVYNQFGQYDPLQALFKTMMYDPLKRAEERLIQVLESDHEYIKGIAIHVLGKIGGPAAVLPIIRLLKKGNSHFRRNAVQTLGSLRDPRARLT